MLQLKNQRSENKTVCDFSIILILEGFMMFESQRAKPFYWTKIWTLIKTKRNRKWKIPHTVLERRTLRFSSYKNPKLTVKLWRVGARERKKRAFFVPFVLTKANFFKIYVLSQIIEYWIHFQNIHTFTYFTY